MLSLGPVRLSMTNLVESGDHWKEFTPFFRFVSSCASPPSRRSIHIWVSAAVAPSVFRDERNARRVPSGLHRGELELKLSLLSRRGAEFPSAATDHMAVRRRFAFWSMVVTT